MIPRSAWHFGGGMRQTTNSWCHTIWNWLSPARPQSMSCSLTTSEEPTNAGHTLANVVANRSLGISCPLRAARQILRSGFCRLEMLVCACVTTDSLAFMLSDSQWQQCTDGHNLQWTPQRESKDHLTTKKCRTTWIHSTY